MTTTMAIQSTTEPQWKQTHQILAEEIENLRSYLVLAIGTVVTNGEKIGKITEKKMSLTGVPEVFVNWSEQCTELVEPRKLKEESKIDSKIHAGDAIVINSQHQTEAGQRFEIKALQGDGWVLTTTLQRFHSDHFYTFSVTDSQK